METHIIMDFYYEPDSPSGVGFDTIPQLSQFEETICQAMDLASRISDSLPEEAKEIMLQEGVSIYRIYSNEEGFWGEWCNPESLDIEEEMSSLMTKITENLKELAGKK